MKINPRIQQTGVFWRWRSVTALTARESRSPDSKDLDRYKSVDRIAGILLKIAENEVVNSSISRGNLQ